MDLEIEDLIEAIKAQSSRNLADLKDSSENLIRDLQKADLRIDLLFNPMSKEKKMMLRE